MCGIFGYVGTNSASERVHNGLQRLEYRGYDSWGIASIVENEIHQYKQVGPISELFENDKRRDSKIGIGHTRWATHGGVSEKNTHPHISSDGKFTLAQNGIVENYQELKKELSSNYKFHTETDTEVIVRLIEKEMTKIDQKSLKDPLFESVRKAFSQLEGRNSIILLDKERNRIIAVRNGSPLVIGVGEEETIIASDTLSFADRTNKVIEMENLEMVLIEGIEIRKYSVKTGEPIKHIVKEIDISISKIDREGYDHFMLKEIVEQKDTIREAIQYTDAELKPLVDAIKGGKVYTVGAGTASFAAGQIAWFLRNYAGIDAESLKSYEVGSYRKIFKEGDLMIAVSQSGETADTIEAVEIAKENGVKVASIVNMVSSTLTKLSDYSYLSRSGPEICVASTKAFTAQISWGLLLTYAVIGKSEEAREAIKKASDYLQVYFTEELFGQIREIAKEIKQNEHFFVLGREQNFQIAQEGALKVKEITYKHFEGFSAGELKHGVIALIEEGTPLFAIISEDEHKSDLMSAVAEVKARGAKVIAISQEPNELFDIHIPSTDMGIADPIVKIVPMQLLSYFLGVELKRDPDKPRNLAKSVTVK